MRQITSSRDVVIRPDIYTTSRDSLKLEIPIEFMIKNNTTKNFDLLDFGFIYDNKKVIVMKDFYIVDSLGNRISRFNLKLEKDKIKNIILITQSSYISNNDSKKVFKKYDVNKDIENFRDSAKIVPYNQFRKDFPQIIKKLDKIPDSIEVTTRNHGEKYYNSKRFKIEW